MVLHCQPCSAAHAAARPHVHKSQNHRAAGVALQTRMFKKRQAKAGGARKTTPTVHASNTTGAPSLLSFGADEDEGPTFEVKKRKLKQKKKRKEESVNAPAPQPVTDYSAAGLAALRGAQTALPAELLAESSKRAACALLLPCAPPVPCSMVSRSAEEGEGDAKRSSWMLSPLASRADSKEAFTFL